MRRFCAADVEQAVRLRTQGYTLWAIAQTMGFSEASVRFQLRKRGLDTSHIHKWTDADYNKLRELYYLGYTIQQIAVHIGRSYKTTVGQVGKMHKEGMLLYKNSKHDANTGKELHQKFIRPIGYGRCETNSRDRSEF